MIYMFGMKSMSMHIFMAIWYSLRRAFREGNGNPLQYSCLETPRDEGAWWAAVHGVAQNRTRQKGLSSSSSSYLCTYQEKLLLCEAKTAP